MSTKHRERFADVGNGGELRFGELQGLMNIHIRRTDLRRLREKLCWWLAICVVFYLGWHQ